MGRKTWDSLPKKPLPNRKNYVISRNQKHVDGADFISMNSAIELIQNEDSDIFIIGGGQIYEKLLSYCEKVFVTKIYKSFESDTFFPDIEKDDTWIYSGFTFEEIKKNKDMSALLDKCSHLVDGMFQLEKRDVSLKFRGSSNQHIWKKENGKWIIEE